MPVPQRRLVVAATAVAGVVVGHAGAYVWAYPSQQSRTAVLHATGHGYWGGAVGVGVAAGLASLVAVGWRASARAETGVRFAPLVAGQIALFATAEALERVASGVPLAALAHAPEFAAGVALQVLVAAVAVVVLRRWCRIVRAVATPARAASRRPAVLAVGAPRAILVLPLVGSPTRARGPPQPAPA
jgi:hypothetical protein